MRYSILTNNWVVTLTATLVGVFVALYLNQWVADRQSRDQKIIATENILTELDNNADKIQPVLEHHREMLDVVEFLEESLDRDGGVTTTPARMSSFRAKYPSIVTIKDSTALGAGLFNYSGELDFDLSTPHLNLSMVAWQTLKSSGIATTYDFECLMYLEAIDKITSEVSRTNQSLLSNFIDGEYNNNGNKKLIKQLKVLIGYEQSLSSMYELRSQKLDHCY